MPFQMIQSQVRVFFCLLYAYYIYGGFGIRCLMNASVKMEFNFQASYGEEQIAPWLVTLTEKEMEQS